MGDVRRMRKARAATTSDTGYTEATQKNRAGMRALVLGGPELPVKKAAEESAANPNDGKNVSLIDANLIAPPYDKLLLAQLPENNSELGQCVEAMEVNIEGFGGRLVLRPMPDAVKEKAKAAIEKEAKELRRFLLGINPAMDLTQIRRRVRRDIETTGEGFVEIIPTKRGDKVSSMGHVESHTFYLAKQDTDFTQITRTLLDPETGEAFEKTYNVRFRRFVQKRAEKKTYFKEWGDPRVVDRRTGKAYKDLAAAKKAQGFDPDKHVANPVMHFPLYSPRTPYGLPRFIGNLFSIFGSRAAEEVNWNTFQNNNIPAMAVLVSGNAMLTEGTIKRIEEFSHNVMARNMNYSKFLVVEAEPAEEGIPNSGTSKVEIVPLANNQHKDQLFQEYDKNSTDKVRRAFRLPPIFVGKSDDYTRATAEASRRLADEQVFAPERNWMDQQFTRLFVDMGYLYWTYKSFGPNVTDDEDLVKVLNGTEKTGALTPNLARKVLSDILNTDIPPYKADEVGFDPDVPFSLTMADRVKGASAAAGADNEPADTKLGGSGKTGKLAPNQGQIPAAKRLRLPAVVREALAAPDAPGAAEVLDEWKDFLNSMLAPERPDAEAS